MTKFLRKVLRYGFRRLLLFVVIKFICKAKSIYWKWFLSDNKPLLNKTKILQPTQFIGRGIIKIGSCQLGVWPSPNLLTGITYLEARNLGSSIVIGDDTFINNVAVIIADKTQVNIGDRCMIGPGFFACDSDFHGLEANNRATYECLPVVIGNDVFIGVDVKIMKGVTIGHGAVIGSGSVVVKDVAANTLYAGVPARFKKIYHWHSEGD